MSAGRARGSQREGRPPEPVSPRIVHRPRVHRLRVRVFYGDTDQMGVAYYANYLRWFEMARNEYLRDIGYPYARLEAEGIRLPVTEAGCRYTSPARYDDLLALDAWIEELGRVRVRFGYRVSQLAESSPAGGRAERDGPWLEVPGGASPAEGTALAVPLAHGFTVHACLSPDGAPRRLPASLLQVLERFETGTAPA